MIGDVISSFRTINGMSMSELGRRSGVSRNTISSLENNKDKKVSLSTLYKLAEAFNIPFYDMLVFNRIQNDNNFNREDVIDIILNYYINNLNKTR